MQDEFNVGDRIMYVNNAGFDVQKGSIENAWVRGEYLIQLDNGMRATVAPKNLRKINDESLQGW